MILIPSYRLTERCPLWTVGNILSLYAPSGLMSRGTSKKIPTTTHLERHTDLLGGCTGLYLICCYLIMLQRCHNSGESSSTSSLWAYPCLRAKPHTSPPQPLLSRCSKEWCPLHYKSDCFTSICSASLCFFPQIYQRWKLSHLLTASVHTQIVWRNQMPKSLNVNTHSTSQDV